MTVRNCSPTEKAFLTRAVTSKQVQAFSKQNARPRKPLITVSRVSYTHCVPEQSLVHGKCQHCSSLSFQQRLIQDNRLKLQRWYWSAASVTRIDYYTDDFAMTLQAPKASAGLQSTKEDYATRGWPGQERFDQLPAQQFGQEVFVTSSADLAKCSGGNNTLSSKHD